MKRYGRWLISIIYWDGILPMALLAIPGWLPLHLLHDDVVCLIYVLLAIAFFFIRIRIACRRFQEADLLGWQWLAFWCGIILLMLLEVSLLGMRDMAHMVTAHDWRVWFVLYGVYWVLMAAAFFPFGEEDTLDEVETY